MNKNRIQGGQGRTSGREIAKSISVKGPGRRFGGCARKAVGLTPGGLRRVPETGLGKPQGGLSASQESADGIVGGGNEPVRRPEGSPHRRLMGDVRQKIQLELALEVAGRGEASTLSQQGTESLRAAHEHNQLNSDAERQFHKLMTEGVAQGLTPDDFATRVFAGIEEGKFWLLPQPEFKHMFGLRTDSIHEEANPVPREDMINLLDS